MSTKYYASREAAKILDVCPNSLRKWADNGEINCIRIKSGQRRYDVDSYIGKSTTSVLPRAVQIRVEHL
ncbi:MAG: helix-turn-helix domain-containing protein [Thiotrichaceae bacterium]